MTRAGHKNDDTAFWPGETREDEFDRTVRDLGLIGFWTGMAACGVLVLVNMRPVLLLLALLAGFVSGVIWWAHRDEANRQRKRQQERSQEWQQEWQQEWPPEWRQGQRQQEQQEQPPQPAPLPGFMIVLGVAVNATLRDCEQAYRALAKEAHPDNGGSNIAMVTLNAAIASARQHFRHAA